MTVIALKRDADPKVIEALEDALAMARTGRLVQVVIAGNLAEDECFWYRASFGDKWTIIGALEWAKITAGTPK